ncbi:heterokaryon incompatibility protein-domain-containing protein, partial [Cercophora samala]
MRLLHTTTLKLTEFPDEDVPRYAILSHTWEDGEVSLADMRSRGWQVKRRKGWQKIAGCCSAAKEWCDYVWIDTCCIDKTSSAELSEAINSMYRWYQGADICLAYLAD